MGSLREYETVFVLHPGLEEARVEEEIEGVRQTILAGEGDIVGLERWGRRKLAYEIQKVHEGIYTLIRFRSDAKVLQDLERRYRLREGVLRHLTVVAQGPPPENPLRRETAATGEAMVEGSPGERHAPSAVGERVADNPAAAGSTKTGSTPETTATSGGTTVGSAEIPAAPEAESEQS